MPAPMTRIFSPTTASPTNTHQADVTFSGNSVEISRLVGNAPVASMTTSVVKGEMSLGVASTPHFTSTPSFSRSRTRDLTTSSSTALQGGTQASCTCPPK